MWKELLREYVKEHNFTNVNDILTGLKLMIIPKIHIQSKIVKTELVFVQLIIPRDRNCDFEPKIVPKHQRAVNGIKDKILGFYAIVMTARDISEQIKELYGVDISAETVSNITNRIYH